MTALPAFASRTPDAADETQLRRELVFVVPGPLDQLTGGYLFDGHIVRGLRARGRVVRVIELTGRRPKADAAVLADLLSTSSTGVRSTRLSATMRVKVGVSKMPRRMYSPIATMTMLSQNGTRHPQSRN